MGHFVGKQMQKYYVHEGKVYDNPGGVLLAIDPETLEPLEVVEFPETATLITNITNPTDWICDHPGCGKVLPFGRGKFFHMKKHPKDN